MGLFKQFADMFRAPTALFKLGGKAWGLLLVYLLLAAGLLAIVGGLLISKQDNLRELIISYVLPESWRFAGGMLIKYFLNSQTKEVLINAAVSGTLVLISVLLFPLKEKLSATFERDAKLTDKDPTEFPLWFQGLEEIKLVILYVTAFMLIFWIGYDPDPIRKVIATVLAFAFTFFTFAIDFISPLLQRHRVRYSQIIKTLLRHPVAAFGFGAVFALPALLLGLWIKKTPDATFTSAVVLLFSVNVVAIVWAAVAGTWMGAQLLEAGERASRSTGPTRAACWLVLLGIFAYNSWIFASLGMALHHKSQILKCDYSVDFSSFGLELPKLKDSGGIKGLLGSAYDTIVKGKPVDVGAYMTVTITNPTKFDVTLEKNRIAIEHEEMNVANTFLSPLQVPASGTLQKRLDFKISLQPQALTKGLDLLNNKWRITLFLEIGPDFEFPIYLLSPEKKKKTKKG